MAAYFKTVWFSDEHLSSNYCHRVSTTNIHTEVLILDHFNLFSNKFILSIPHPHQALIFQRIGATAEKLAS